MESNKKCLLVIGGRGALGAALVEHFKNAWVASVDHGESCKADLSINVVHLSSAAEQAEWIESKLKEALKIGKDSSSKVLNGIICVAGGWTGGNVQSSCFLNSVEQMWKQSVVSSAIAAYLAGRYLKDDGLLVMTGAQAALGPTPGMVGYGMAKASVHHLIKSLACEGSGLPKKCVIVGLLPRTLDTPNNRKFATGPVDYGSWTPLSHITGLIDGWMSSKELSGVSSGNLVELVTTNGETSIELH